MGYNTLQSQYLTIPVYIFGGIAFLSFAFISDKLRIRGPVSVTCTGLRVRQYPELMVHSLFSSQTFLASSDTFYSSQIRLKESNSSEPFSAPSQSTMGLA